MNIPRRDSQRGGVWGGRFIVWGACRGVGEGFTVWEEGFTGCGGGAHRMWGRGSQGVGEGLTGCGGSGSGCGAHRVWDGAYQVFMQNWVFFFQ